MVDNPGFNLGGLDTWGEQVEFNTDRHHMIAYAKTTSDPLAAHPSVQPRGDGSAATLDAEFTSQMMVGAIGAAIELASKTELDASLDTLAALDR